MDRYEAEAGRSIYEEAIECDVCVVGGGLAGVCAAITAARHGARVTLVQDRPVLGGNASSEVRLWTLGATSHMNNNNRWAREGGVIDEILVENMFRNPEGNPMFFDTTLLEMTTVEPNLRLLLNTAAQKVTIDDGARITEVRAYNSQNETDYRISAGFIIDASGDGVVAFQAGVPYRFGAETEEEFGEKFVPDPEVYGERLGHSIFFYTRDVGRPITFVPPAYALNNVSDKIPRYKNFAVSQNGCQFWWIEYGGRLDTVHDTEKIKWELWKVVLGVWNYIKNSGEHPEAENLTLEWMGAIPGKRESRRFEGYSMLVQQDLIEQRVHGDVVSYGGWSIDLHPADGVYASLPGCTQLHAKGVYQIPFGTMVTPHVPNLFLAGRIISASHVAFGSTRVMATCANGAQAVGLAAALATEKGLQPADFRAGPHLEELQLSLVRAGQYIPQHPVDDPQDLSGGAEISASTEMKLDLLNRPAPARILLDRPRAQLLPLSAGAIPGMEFRADVAVDAQLTVRLYRSSKPFNFTPDVELAAHSVNLAAGIDRPVVIDVDASLDTAQYIFVAFDANPSVRMHAVEDRISGLLSVAYRRDQTADTDIGVEEFGFWTPDRRPGGQLFAFSVNEGYDAGAFAPGHVASNLHRPVSGPNAWVARIDDPLPTLSLRWDSLQPIRRIHLFFDTDADHPMESVLWGQPERAMPYCVRSYEIVADNGSVLWTETENHQTRNEVLFEQTVKTTSLEIRIESVWGRAPASLFGVHCYNL